LNVFLYAHGRPIPDHQSGRDEHKSRFITHHPTVVIAFINTLFQPLRNLRRPVPACHTGRTIPPSSPPSPPLHTFNTTHAGRCTDTTPLKTRLVAPTRIVPPLKTEQCSRSHPRTYAHNLQRHQQVYYSNPNRSQAKHKHRISRTSTAPGSLTTSASQATRY
jgi:hypothetical protein